MKYFFIGERELVLAFNLVGVAGQEVSNKEEALTIFKQITNNSSQSSMETKVNECPVVLIISEEVSTWIFQEVNEWQMKCQYPLIVEVPSLHGKLQNKKTLTDIIREAVGIHV